MRAATYHGPNDLRIEDRERPGLGRGEVLVKVIGCGVCGTDVRIVSGGHRHYPPGTVRVPGHEIVGTVVEVGSDATVPLPGGRVFVAPNFGCGVCRECLTGNNNRCDKFQALGITVDGGFAEFVRVPAAAVAQGNLIALRDSLDPAVATLIEPLACVLRGQDPLHIGPGDAVLVVGAGPIGILHAMLARLKGAARVLIADRWPARLDLAGRQGADVLINIGEVDIERATKEATEGRGPDAIIVAAPAREAMALSLRLAALGGRISYFAGLPKDESTLALDANAIHYRELAVTGTTACSTRDCQRAADIANSSRLDLTSLVTSRAKLDQLPDIIARRDRASIKTVVTTG